MPFRNTETSYGSVSRFFHWLIAFLVIVMLTVGFYMGDFPKDWKPVIYSVHKLTGVLILVLVVLRALWLILVSRRPLPLANMPHWQVVIERFVHALFYVFLIAMPLVGLIGSVAAGKPPHLGGFAITLPIHQNKTLVEVAFDLHNRFAYALIILIVLHVLAALYHHLIKRDDTLTRML